MPDHAHPAVLVWMHGGAGGGGGFAGGVELVVSGDFLDETVAVGLEDGEVAQEVEEGGGSERAFDEDLELRAVVFEGVAVDGAPSFEPFPASGEGTETSVGAIRSDEEGVGE